MSLWQWFTDPANWTGDDGIPVRFWQQVSMSLIAVVVALAVALPLGIWLGHKQRGGFLAISVSNIGRAVPTFGLLMIFASMDWWFLGVGDGSAVLALIVFAIPPILTNAYIGIRDVDDEIRSAARGMGFTGGLMLWKVELPNSVPLIAAGIRTATVQAVAAASLAAFVGGGGFGAYVLEGFAIQDPTLYIGGAILTAVLAVLTELVLAFAQRRLTPRGLRLRDTQLAAGG